MHFLQPLTFAWVGEPCSKECVGTQKFRVAFHGFTLADNGERVPHRELDLEIEASERIEQLKVRLAQLWHGSIMSEFDPMWVGCKRKVDDSSVQYEQMVTSMDGTRVGELRRATQDARDN